MMISYSFSTSTHFLLSSLLFRSGKTDYAARKALVVQDQNKYGTPKYRLIVRFTNKDIVCQVAYTGFKGDVIIAAAYAHELKEYGVPVGHTNHAAAYATGLLVARRVLTKLKLADRYAGQEEPDGEPYRVEAEEDGPRPFYCVLDTGLKATTTGSKIFTALKGALDGGLDIPHNEKRMIGYDPDAKEFDADMMQSYIFGGPVQEYIEYLEEEDPDLLRKQFSSYMEEEIGADDMEDLWADCHSKIRENPILPKKPRGKSGKNWNQPKLTREERKANLKEKLAALME
jgi:large subunit ribosomal protein L5e